jgi:toxin ParE1/3/4
MRRVAADPAGLSTAERAELLPGLRSFHIRHSREESSEHRVGSPVHVLYYRLVAPGVLEIVRVLHERSEPGRHIREER